MTLWQARLAAEPASSLLSYTRSLSFDQRLAPYDLAATAAHVEGLAACGLLSSGERAALIGALEGVGTEIARGDFVFVETDEDIHTAIERRVTELAGPIGGKLHTGRSRNDQVATATRLWTRAALSEIADGVVGLQEVLARRASEAGGTYLPGYTHLQRAQPVLLAHHLLAHAWALARDIDRMLDCIERLEVCPMGAGALAGSSLPLQPDVVAGTLGFTSVFANSLDAVADRDFVAEALFVMAMVGIHLSRLGEEIVLWSTEEFGFVSLSDEYSTGSSMLPQKKNADVAELARGKAGRLVGNMVGWLATLKGLPLSYNRDLQEDKEPLFDSADQLRRGLSALAGLVKTMEFDAVRMKEAADSPFAAAVDVAEWLVAGGTPFREAYGRVASLVRESLTRDALFPELVKKELGDEAAALLAPGVAVTRRTTPGGAGPIPVAHQAEAFARVLGDEKRRLGEVVDRMPATIVG